MSTRRETSHVPSAGYDEHSLDDFLTCTDAIILFLDPLTMKIEKASKGAVEFYGWSREEIIGKNLCDIELLDEAAIRKSLKKSCLLIKGAFLSNIAPRMERSPTWKSF